jgi:hypothetical protein
VHEHRTHEIFLWHVLQQKQIRCLAIAPPRDPEVVYGPYSTCTTLTFSPDGRYLAGGIQRKPTPWRRAPIPQSTVVVWEIASGEKTLSLRGLGWRAPTIQFAPDGRTLLHSFPSDANADYARSGAAGSYYRYANSESAVTLRDLRAGNDFTHFIGSGPARLCATTGEELPIIQGAFDCTTQAVFSPDGKSLAFVDANRTILVWDMSAGWPRHPQPAVKLSPVDLELAWNNLASGDASIATTAIWQLTRDPEPTLAFLKSRLKPPMLLDDKRLEQLIDLLGSDTYTVREQATQQLQQCGELAEPVLRKMLLRQPHPERKRRLEGLLARLEDDSRSDQLQWQRAVEVLEKIDHPAARKFLDELAQGPSAARLTSVARTALTRWDRRHSSP